MNIILAGGGKVGLTLARQLAAEGHDLTLIDKNSQVLNTAVEHYDAIGITGNCASMEVLRQAGVESAELLIASTHSDELNLLCCMTAHGINPKIHTIARIRDPEYADQVMTMRDVFHLSMTINPEKLAAAEIERLIKYPGFLRRDTFAKGRSVIVELRVDKSSKLCDAAMFDLPGIVGCRVLVCAVLRSGDVIIPKGNFILREGDRIFVTAPTAQLTTLLKNLGIITKRVRDVMICGGGRVSYYLAKLLEKDKISVQIIERNYERCVELATLLPDTSIVHGDCSNQNTLEDQCISDCEALVALTGLDETNMVISLYAHSRGVGQTITKLSRSENSSIADSIALGSLVYPKELCCNHIVRYVRAMENQTGAAVSVHSIADGQAEAVEFRVNSSTENCGVPLKQIRLQPNVLIASIIHGSITEIPNGDSVFHPGDSLVVVCGQRGALNQLNDIFD